MRLKIHSFIHLHYSIQTIPITSKAFLAFIFKVRISQLYNSQVLWLSPLQYYIFCVVRHAATHCATWCTPCEAAMTISSRWQMP
jgi:hypothetical protein